MALWYVLADRTKVTWASAVVGGVAQVDVFEVDRRGDTAELVYLWRRAGQPASPAVVAAAQAREDPGPVPDPPSLPPAGSGGLRAATDVRTFGLDPTGTAAANTAAFAAAVAAAPVGAAFTVPGGSSFALDDTLVLDKRVTLLGPGELRWTAGIAQKPAVSVRADGSRVSGLRLVNPSELQASSGERNYGVEVKANDVTVDYCLIDRFQNGIAVRADGEWHNHTIIGNRIKDCIGVGAEDRGDGIITWGAQAVIAGNVINAKAGHDCRIGIHAESLEGSRTANAPFNDGAVVVQGNVVYGKFRRGIAYEGIRGGSVVGNFVADSTWWALAMLVGTTDVTVADNVVWWTRTAADTQGASFSPNRAPVMLYGSVSDIRIGGNTVRVGDGAEALSYLVLQGPASNNQPVDCTIEANRFHREPTGTLTANGIGVVNMCSRPRIVRNHVEGFATRGVALFGTDRPEVRDNTFAGIAGTSTLGVYTTGNGNGAIVTGNVIRNVAKGIELNGHSAGPVIVQGNALTEGVTGAGIDLNGCTSGICADNWTGGVAGNKTQNINAAIRTDNNTALQGTFTWDPGSLADGAGETSAAVTVTGAALGDYVQVAAPYNLQGITCTAYVSAANTITVRLQNETGATVDLASGTWKVRVVGR